LRRQSGFKQTEIGKIPKEWKVVRMEDIFSLEYGRGLTEKDRERGNYPVYGSNGIVGFHSKYLVRGPGIIVGRKGTIGAATWSDKDFWPIDTTYYIVLRKSERDLRWLFYELSSLNLPRLNMATGTPGLNRDLVYKLRVPLPSLPEQKKIAEVLSTVDQAIEKIDEAIAKTERVKKGLMQELLTKGIGHKSFKQTEIGKIPKEWDVVKVGEVAEIHDSKRIPLSEMERGKRRGSYPYCGANGIIDYIDDYIFDGEFVLLAEDGGDYNKFGNSAYIMKEKFWVNNHAHILKAMENEITNLFLYYVFNFFDLNYYVVGSTRKKLNQERMKKISIPRPILPEQKRITAILTTLDKRLQLLKEKKGRLKKVKRGLMSDLLTGKKRVRLEA